LNERNGYGQFAQYGIALIAAAAAAAALIDARTPSIQAGLTAQTYRATLRADAAGPEPAALWRTAEHWREKCFERRRHKRNDIVRVGDSVTALATDDSSLTFTISCSAGGAVLKPFEVIAAVCEVDPTLFEVEKIAVEWGQGVGSIGP